MARIVYKEGCEGQNKLSSIEGIEIDLLNGQKALIYPKYSEKMILPSEKRALWEAKRMSEIEALKETDTSYETSQLFALDSPAALWVAKFRSDAHGIFCLPSLLAAMELQQEKKEIDALAETIEGADLLRDFTSVVWSCSRCYASSCWYAYGSFGCAGSHGLGGSYLAVPTIILDITVRRNNYGKEDNQKGITSPIQEMSTFGHKGFDGGREVGKDGKYDYRKRC